MEVAVKRGLARSREVGEILARNGLRALADSAGLSRRPSDPPRSDASIRAVENTRPEVLVSTLTELGTAWIKLGQTLATRRDLIPAEYCDALEALTDHTAPAPFADIRATIATSLGADPSALFRHIDPVPLGSASVGQVHPAITSDGREVVVKVRKPGVLENVHIDLELMERLVKAMCRARPQLEELGVIETMQTFAATLRAELDFRTEASNCEEMRSRFASDEAIAIPAVYRDLTTADVLTQERIVGGIRLDDLESMRAAGIDPDRAGRRYVDALMRMLLTFGRFHADPHPGNVYVHLDGHLTFIDWGMVGHVDTATRRALLRLIAGFAIPHEGLLISALLDLATPRRHLDRPKLRRDVGELVHILRSTTLSELSAAEVGGLITRIVRAHRLRLDPSIPVALRAMSVAEGLVRRLSPHLSLPDLAAVQAREAFGADMRPEQLRQIATDLLGDAMVFAHDLPARVSRVLDVIESGESEVTVAGDSLQKMRRQRDRDTRRLVGGMLASSGIIAGSIVWSAWYRARK
nr:AarF/UbiB family protein [Dermatophilus congolensis]